MSKKHVARILWPHLGFNFLILWNYFGCSRYVHTLSILDWQFRGSGRIETFHPHSLVVGELRLSHPHPLVDRASPISVGDETMTPSHE